MSFVHGMDQCRRGCSHRCRPPRSLPGGRSSFDGFPLNRGFLAVAVVVAHVVRRQYQALPADAMVGHYLTSHMVAVQYPPFIFSVLKGFSSALFFLLTFGANLCVLLIDCTTYELLNLVLKYIRYITRSFGHSPDKTLLDGLTQP